MISSALALDLSGRRGFVDAAGYRLSYLEWGPRDKPALLLLHWGTGMAADWEWVASVFWNTYRVVAPDLRGRGESDRALDLHAYGKYESLADLELIVDSLRLSDLVIVGSSFGAAMAALFAGRHPDLVRAAILDDGGPPVGRLIGTLLQSHLGVRPDDWGAVQDTFDSLAEASAYPDPWSGPPPRPLEQMLAYVRSLPASSWIYRRARQRFRERSESYYQRVCKWRGGYPPA